MIKKRLIGLRRISSINRSRKLFRFFCNHLEIVLTTKLAASMDEPEDALGILSGNCDPEFQER